jgi:hypothetical protein
MFLENPYQLSYVTADLDQAIAVMKEQFGVEGFRILSGSGPGLRVWTPEGEGDMVVKTAVARAGKWIIEIMEPVSGPVGHFRDHLQPGKPLTLHHIGVMTDDIDAARAASEKMGRPVVMAADFKGGRLIYVDARATLGHYVEYVWAAPRPEAAA